MATYDSQATDFGGRFTFMIAALRHRPQRLIFEGTTYTLLSEVTENPAQLVAIGDDDYAPTIFRLDSAVAPERVVEYRDPQLKLLTPGRLTVDELIDRVTEAHFKALQQSACSSPGEIAQQAIDGHLAVGMFSVDTLGSAFALMLYDRRETTDRETRAITARLHPGHDASEQRTACAEALKILALDRHQHILQAKIAIEQELEFLKK